jgi:hypothetical protein
VEEALLFQSINTGEIEIFLKIMCTLRFQKSDICISRPIKRISVFKERLVNVVDLLDYQRKTI